MKPIKLRAALAAALGILSAGSLAAQAAVAAPGTEVQGLTIAPGSNATELGFAWFGPAAVKPAVQIAPRAAIKGGAFPAASARTFTGTSSRVTATQAATDDLTVPVGTSSNKVTVKGLAASTEYVYRVGDGKTWSPSYTVATRDPSRFSFFVVGDPQLGSKSGVGSKTLDADQAGWQATLTRAVTAFPEAGFLISLGDQVNDYVSLAAQEAEYQAFFSPPELRSLPLAAIDGNHDFMMGELYGFHYNLPNVSRQYGISYGNDGDYWFTYGSVLFLMLNSNTQSIAAHDIFIRDAVGKNPNAKWRIVCFHHSIYSEAEHTADPDILDRRATFPIAFERYKIDAVLMGHDHSYTRTLPLLKGKPVEGADPKADMITDPAGIVYVTLDSASGSKFYDWKDQTPQAFSAVRWQGKAPSFSRISVEGKKLSVMTFRADDMSLIDMFSVEKSK